MYCILLLVDMVLEQVRGLRVSRCPDHNLVAASLIRAAPLTIDNANTNSRSAILQSLLSTLTWSAGASWLFVSYPAFATSSSAARVCSSNKNVDDDNDNVLFLLLHIPPLLLDGFNGG